MVVIAFRLWTMSKWCHRHRHRRAARLLKTVIFLVFGAILRGYGCSFAVGGSVPSMVWPSASFRWVAVWLKRHWASGARAEHECGGECLTYVETGVSNRHRSDVPLAWQAITRLLPRQRVGSFACGLEAVSKVADEPGSVTLTLVADRAPKAHSSRFVGSDNCV
jgi:hypothetical protein